MRRMTLSSMKSQTSSSMKIRKKNAAGESRELLLKEYFLNAYLIAMLKRVGEEARKFNQGSTFEGLEPAPVKARHLSR